MSRENKDFRNHNRFCKADGVILCYNDFPSVLRIKFKDRISGRTRISENRNMRKE